MWVRYELGDLLSVSSHESSGVVPVCLGVPGRSLVVGVGLSCWYNSIMSSGMCPHVLAMCSIRLVIRWVSDCAVERGWRMLPGVPFVVGLVFPCMVVIFSL